FKALFYLSFTPLREQILPTFFMMANNDNENVTNLLNDLRSCINNNNNNNNNDGNNDNNRFSSLRSKLCRWLRSRMCPPNDEVTDNVYWYYILIANNPNNESKPFRTVNKFQFLFYSARYHLSQAVESDEC